MHSPRCAGEFSSCSLLYRPPPWKYLGGGVGRRCCLVDLTAADGVATAVHGDAGAKVIDVEIAEPPAAVDDLPVAAEAEIVAVVNVDLVAVVVAVVITVVITVVIAVVVAVEVVLVVPTVTVVVLDYVELVGVEGKVPALDGQGGVEVKDAQSGLGAAGVGGRVEAHGRDRVVAAAVDANRLAHLAGVAVLLGLLASFEARRHLEVADVVEADPLVAVNIVAVVAVVVAVVVVVVVVLVLAVMVRRRVTLMVREGWSCGQHQGHEPHHRRKQHHLLHLLILSFFVCFVIPDWALAERHRALRLLVRKTHPFFFWVPSLGLLPCARFVGLAEEASAVRTRTALRVALWDACVHAQMREESGRD